MTTSVLDIETDPSLFVIQEPVDPYAGLNRQQRRKALAHERRAFRKLHRNERR